MLGRGLAVAAAAAVLDQITKGLVLGFFDETGGATHRRAVTSFLDLVLTWSCRARTVFLYWRLLACPRPCCSGAAPTCGWPWAWTGSARTSSPSSRGRR